MRLRTGSPQEAGMSPARVRRVVDLARSWVAEGIHPALVVLVARKGVVVIHEAFGRLTPAADSPPLELDAVFPLYSLTKPITATAAMILVEDGLLGLNRPVWWYVPEFAGEGKDAVMVHHLLTHTSGLRDEDVDAYAEERKGCVRIPPLGDETQDPRPHEYLHLRWGAAQWNPPGVEQYYGSYGYNLLGEIVRRVSGRSLTDFCRERIFHPLGMVDTHFELPEADKQRIVARLVGPDSGAEFLEWPGGPWGASGAFSSARDMAILGQLFLNGGRYGDARILSPWAVAEMTHDQIPGVGTHYKDYVAREVCWGLGWNVRGVENGLDYGETLQSREAFSHSGWGGVFMWVDPIHDIVGIYLGVDSDGGIPAGVVVPEWLSEWTILLGRADLFVNAVTAAVLD